MVENLRGRRRTAGLTALTRAVGDALLIGALLVAVLLLCALKVPGFPRPWADDAGQAVAAPGASGSQNAPGALGAPAPRPGAPGRELARGGPPMNPRLLLGGALVVAGSGLAMFVLYRSRQQETPAD
ncbi:hypothetical protein ACFP1Z_21870 [Streptomyces gamaensis]|uniref:Uncharacterized protein n=1 Tax=Streptomyces gamaensis TaxID=1763542 RepID=A0ABW0Z8T8_9ACTN